MRLQGLLFTIFFLTTFAMSSRGTERVEDCADVAQLMPALLVELRILNVVPVSRSKAHLAKNRPWDLAFLKDTVIVGGAHFTIDPPAGEAVVDFVDANSHFVLSAEEEYDPCSAPGGRCGFSQVTTLTSKGVMDFLRIATEKGGDWFINNKSTDERKWREGLLLELRKSLNYYPGTKKALKLESLTPKETIVAAMAGDSVLSPYLDHVDFEENDKKVIRVTGVVSSNALHHQISSLILDLGFYPNMWLRVDTGFVLPTPRCKLGDILSRPLMLEE